MVGMLPVPRVLPRLHRLAVVSALLVFGGLGAAAIGIERAESASVRVLGAAAPATPSCFGSDCQVIARVTGFQRAIAGKRKPFVAPFPGRIVAWSIKLGRPSKEDFRCLTEGCENFAPFGPSKARLSILKPLRREFRRGRPIFRLLRQSPVELLAPYFGSTTTFTLQYPLKIAKGQVAALTVPTWAPAFTVGLGTNSTWRASRKRTRCAASNDNELNLRQVRAGRAQMVKGSERIYGCNYRTARLLYSATMVRRPAG